jgi:predicted GNAT family acetyltransferase
VLFTPDDNLAAQAAYRALGYRVTGDYGLVFF